MPLKSTPITISATLLRLLSTCERRVWLDTYGDTDQRSDVSSARIVPLTRGILHEERILATATPHIRHVPAASWDEAAVVTRQSMRDGSPVIHGACLDVEINLPEFGQAVRLIGRVDRLERMEQADRPLYTPVEIKQYATLADADRLQLDLYLYILQHIQDVVVPGWFWLGADHAGKPAAVVPHELDESRLAEAFRRLSRVLRQKTEPPVQIEAHCRQCHWYESCINAIKESRHISLLPHLSSKTKAHLVEAGIHTVDQFALLSVAELQKIKGIKTTAPGLRANAQAFVRQEPVWFNHLTADVRQGGWMLDLETLALVGRSEEMWSVGWAGSDGHTRIVIVGDESRQQTLSHPYPLTIHIVPDADSGWYTLLDFLRHDDAPIFHWSGFDAKILSRTAPGEVRNALLDRMHDLH
ncbi:MAG: TM0106 family RecB-like putative nuclease, partial [Anaerolineae bacterium]|nr:TM0106 family RecB-like putative nuclease [Anaerolineae bacterium]